MRIPPGYAPPTPSGPQPQGDPAPKETRSPDHCLRLRIESDGTAYGTRICEATTGRVLPVQSVTWSMDVRDGAGNRAATATIVVPLVEVAVGAEARVEGALHFTVPPVPAKAKAKAKPDQT